MLPGSPKEYGTASVYNQQTDRGIVAAEFLMPKLGLTMEAGTIIDWLVPDGAEVSEKTPVLLIETDKVETEVEAGGSGVLQRSGDVGETYPCGTRLGWILEIGESPPSPASEEERKVEEVDQQTWSRSQRAGDLDGPGKDGSNPSRRPLASPNARRVAAELGIDLAEMAGSGPDGRIVSADVELAVRAAASEVPSRPDLRVPAGVRPALATFAARQLASQLGVELSTISSTSGGPRLTREDVVRHIRGLLAGSADRETLTPVLSQEPKSVIPMTGMRRLIAERMHSSLREMAQLTLAMDVRMDEIVVHRTRFPGEGQVPSYTDYVIAATSRALVQHPIVNSQMTDEGLALLPEINVGLAVALEEGLVVPVVRGADRFSIADLATETSRLASAARSGKLELADVEGGTFSVTALGMFGVDGFTPVINPPNTAVLGIGRIRDQATWNEKGRIKKAQVLTLSLTWDHRAFDGAPAARFVSTIRNFLEEAQFDV